MNLKTIISIQDGYVSVNLEQYEENKCKNILIERNSYVLKVQHSWGEDYGGSQSSDESETSYEEIIPERILVKDGHFAGVSICIEYNYYNGGGKTIYEDAVILLDKTIKVNTVKAKDGFYFSNDDHSRWNYRIYSLVPRSEANER